MASYARGVTEACHNISAPLFHVSIETRRELCSLSLCSNGVEINKSLKAKDLVSVNSARAVRATSAESVRGTAHVVTNGGEDRALVWEDVEK